MKAIVIIAAILILYCYVIAFTIKRYFVSLKKRNKMTQIFFNKDIYLTKKQSSLLVLQMANAF